MSNYFNGNGTIGFTCDVCGRELNSYSVVNGMKFCAKCYQETFGKDNQQNEIQKLKQQLEEKDKLLKCYQDEEKLIAKILGDESLTIIGSRVHLENLIVELKNKIRDRDLIIEEKDKEKTQLAIQELEKVRSCCENYALELDKCKDNETNNEIIKYLYIISEIIDNQIKKLKGE